ncbi:hypothetical protein [Mesorhizobium sp. WSM4906]|nr:hypothetical protein [Mesorhizobium sp. WSM4906]WFP74542.1 hypothetical protein QAZ22_22730 [Mesorhizobium sp. WSM4906]
MRPILLIAAAVVAFFIWDDSANKSAYRIALMKTVDQVENFQGPVRVTWN